MQNRFNSDSLHPMTTAIKINPAREPSGKVVPVTAEFHQSLDAKILVSCVQAIRFFGMLTPSDIAEKLALRREHVSVNDVARVLAEHVKDPKAFHYVKLSDFRGNAELHPFDRLYKN